jgi:signal transduction histidine kinase
MKDETERVSKEREIFFASMSHELRNPLNSLLGCIELMKDSNEAVRESLLETAQVCSETLLNLIGNIIDVSKIRNNKFELLPSSVDLKDSLTKIMNMMKSLAENKGIYLKMKFRKKFPYYVEFDYNKFNQVLINIISNAIKFTERGGVFVNVEWTPILNNQIQGREDPLFRMLLGSSSRKRIIESVDGIYVLHL